MLLVAVIKYFKITLCVLSAFVSATRNVYVFF